MTLVDTSVWADHFRKPNSILLTLVETRQLAGHPFVLGELVMGNLRNRDEFVFNYRLLPQAPVADEQHVHYLLNTHRLWGMGLGWVDLHLLTSAALAGWDLLTNDKALQSALSRLRR